MHWRGQRRPVAGLLGSVLWIRDCHRERGHLPSLSELSPTGHLEVGRVGFCGLTTSVAPRQDISGLGPSGYSSLIVAADFERQ